MLLTLTNRLGCRRNLRQQLNWFIVRNLKSNLQKRSYEQMPAKRRKEERLLEGKGHLFGRWRGLRKRIGQFWRWYTATNIEHKIECFSFTHVVLDTLVSLRSRIFAFFPGKKFQGWLRIAVDRRLCKLSELNVTETQARICAWRN